MMQVLHQYNSVQDCILWFILFSKILFSLLFAVLSSNDVSPRTPWPQEGPLMSPLSTVGGLWGVLSGVCQNSPLCLKTDPTRVLFQAASTLLTNSDLRKCFSRSNCGFHPKSGLTWDWSVLERRREEEQWDSKVCVGWFYHTRIYRKSCSPQWPGGEHGLVLMMLDGDDAVNDGD